MVLGKLRQTDFQHAPLFTLQRLLQYYDRVSPIDDLLKWVLEGDYAVWFNDFYLPEDEELLP
jgi:hypothetical protein